MAIRSASVIHDANGFVVDRIQSGGISNLNIPEEKIYETGNQESVTTIRDIADLTFDIESFDVSTEMEALSLGLDPGSVSTGQELDFDDALPLDITSPFKASGAYNVVKGIAIPYLTLESVTYRFGVRQNSTQSFSYRGDSVYYIPGTPMYQEITLVDDTLTYSLDETALEYEEGGDSLYVLSATVKNASTGISKRLFIGQDYTNTTTAITLLADWYDEGYTKLHVVFGTGTAVNYPQTVHEGVGVKPGAVRGKDIDIYVWDSRLATPDYVRWTGVQSFEATRRVSLEADEEMGNYKIVAQDYEVADVNGSIGVKPVDLDDLWDKIHQIANVSDATKIVGAYSSVALPMKAVINDPDTGDTLKTIYVPDARFTLPDGQAQVQQKIQKSFGWSSDSGKLLVYKGAKP